MTGTAIEPPPLPPRDLETRRPVEEVLRPGTSLHRFYNVGLDPIYFDKGVDGRFNAPDGSYGVLYAAETARGAFAETFLRVPGRTLLPPDLIARKAHVTIRLNRPLKLVRMAGPGLARIGATAQVVHGGKPYDCPQAWSRAILNHPRVYDGIAYNARHDDGELCYAIFERVAGQVQEVGRTEDLDRDWFWDIGGIYDVGLSPP